MDFFPLLDHNPLTGGSDTANRATMPGCVSGSLQRRIAGRGGFASPPVAAWAALLLAAFLARPVLAAQPPGAEGLLHPDDTNARKDVLASKPRKPSQKAFWSLVTVATASNILDLEYTQHLLHESPTVYETDPIYGRRPSRLEAYPISFALQAGYTLGAYELRRHRLRFIWSGPLMYLTYSHLAGFEQGLRTQRQLDLMLHGSSLDRTAGGSPVTIAPKMTPATLPR